MADPAPPPAGAIRDPAARMAWAATRRVTLLVPDASELTAATIGADWSGWAEPAQRAPAGDWRIWLFMGGRGSGKTRAGAEWVRAQVEARAAARIALVGPTLSDVREVMIEGPSGLRSVGLANRRPVYEVARRRLVWPSGAEAFAFSAEDPDSLRGPQFDAAWCDEIGAWARDEPTWDMLMFALRLGGHPRVAATTTPRARPLVKRLARWVADRRDGIALTRAATRDNAHNLARGFVDAMEDAYAGAVLARQELDGDLVEDPPGGLFTRAVIERGRVRLSDMSTESPSPCGEGLNVSHAPAFDRLIVAIDPPATSGPRADACGIVVAGRIGATVYVLEDASARGLKPLQWAARAVAAARRWGAGEIVAESNQGGEMVRQILAMAGASPRDGLRVTLRHASQSKAARAQPVSALYDQGAVRHAGVFRELEDEMCAFGAPGERSPDRVDALVWAVASLAIGSGPPPSARSL